MSYQIRVTDVDGTSFIVAMVDDAHEAKKRMTFMIEAHRTDNFYLKSPLWRSIELHRVEMISITRLDLGGESS
jgi:hypothetical protein